MLEEGLIKKRKAKVYVGLPTLKSRVIELSKSLNILVVMFNGEGEGGVVNKFYSCFHKIYMIFLL
jgi:hypothetical protein